MDAILLNEIQEQIQKKASYFDFGEDTQILNRNIVNDNIVSRHSINIKSKLYYIVYASNKTLNLFEIDLLTNTKIRKATITFTDATIYANREYSYGIANETINNDGFYLYVYTSSTVCSVYKYTISSNSLIKVKDNIGVNTDYRILGVSFNNKYIYAVNSQNVNCYPIGSGSAKTLLSTSSMSPYTFSRYDGTNRRIIVCGRQVDKNIIYVDLNSEGNDKEESGFIFLKEEVKSTFMSGSQNAYVCTKDLFFFPVTNTYKDWQIFDCKTLRSKIINCYELPTALNQAFCCFGLDEQGVLHTNVGIIDLIQKNYFTKDEIIYTDGSVIDLKNKSLVPSSNKFTIPLSGLYGLVNYSYLRIN